MTEHPEQGPGAQQPVAGTGHGAFDPYAPPSSTPPPSAPPSSTPPPGGPPDSPWASASPTYPPPAPAWPQPSWPSYPPPDAWGTGNYPAPRTTNPWAIVALVTGILSLVPVAVGAGIAALVQIRRRGQAGAGLAIAGIVAAGLWTVIALVVAAAFFFFLGSSDALGRVADAGSTSVSSCLREPTGDRSISTVVDCGEVHDAEVYLADDLGEGPWPGSDTIEGRGDDACYGAFEGYVGTSYDSSNYDYGFFLPDQGEWSAGEHRVVCVVLTGGDDTLRGSARGSGR